MENAESRRFLVDYVGENVVLESLEETISFYYFGVMIFVMYLALNMFMCVWYPRLLVLVEYFRKCSFYLSVEQGLLFLIDGTVFIQ